MSDLHLPPHPKSESISLIPDTKAMRTIKWVYGIATAGSFLLGFSFAAKLIGSAGSAQVASLWAAFLFSTFFTAFFGLVWYFRTTLVPSRIELKDGKVCIYHRFRHTYVAVKDLVAIRAFQPMIPDVRGYSKSTIVVESKDRRRYYIPVDSFEDPARARETLTAYLRPKLREFADQPPSTITFGPSGEILATWLTASAVLPFLLANLTNQYDNPFVVTAIFGMGLVTVAFCFIKLTTRRVFTLEDVTSTTLQQSTTFRFSDVKTIEIRVVFDEVTLAVHAEGYHPSDLIRDVNYKPLLSLSSKMKDFPHIRDFILLRCPNAQVVGNFDMKGLRLYAFDVPPNQVHNQTLPGTDQSAIQEPRFQTLTNQNQAGGP